jgi:hypothetical protein
MIGTNGNRNLQTEELDQGISSQDSVPQPKEQSLINTLGKILTSSQTIWRQKLLSEKLLAYTQFYKETGKINFPALEFVAHMAAEGTVFPPDKAEDIINRITEFATDIKSRSPNLQKQLEQIYNLQVYDSNELRKQVTQLTEAITYLIKTIESNVLPLIPLVQQKWGEEVRSHLSSLTNASAYVQKKTDADIQLARETNRTALQPSIDNLSTINNSAQKLMVCSTEMIRARVPFYHLT